MTFHPITPPWDVHIAGARPQSNRCVAEKKKGNDMEVGPSVVLNVAKLNCSNIKWLLQNSTAQILTARQGGKLFKFSANRMKCQIYLRISKVPPKLFKLNIKLL